MTTHIQHTVTIRELKGSAGSMMPTYTPHQIIQMTDDYDDVIDKSGAIAEISHAAVTWFISSN